MQYRQDNKSGNKLSALGFGCMRFPVKRLGFDLDAVRELVVHAIEAGVNYFDTAYIYGNSEEVLGKVLTPELRGKIFLATKMPVYLVRNAENFDKFFETQLKRLKTDYIDYYLMHMLTSMDSWERLKALGVADWIKRERARGRIKNIGFSYHGGKADFLAILDDYPWEFVQIQYNYLDENNQAGREGLNAAHAKGLPVIIMEPLRGGRLANLPPSALAILDKAGPASKAESDPMAEPAPKTETAASAALSWLWNQPEVTVVLSGMSDMRQLEENIAVASRVTAGSVSDELLAAVDSVKTELEKVTKVPCTGCGYCMPCPFNVDIPTCFSIYNMAFMYNARTARMSYMQNMNSFSSAPHNASNCRKCGKCVSHCPQGIDIPGELTAVSKLLETRLISLATAVYRKFMRIKKK